LHGCTGALSSIAPTLASRGSPSRRSPPTIEAMAADELREVFHLCPEATVQTDPREGVTVHGPHEPLALGRLAPGLRAVLDGLTHAGATGRELLELHRGAAKDEKPTEAIALLGRLARSDRLCRTLEWQGTPLL